MPLLRNVVVQSGGVTTERQKLTAWDKPSGLAGPLRLQDRFEHQFEPQAGNLGNPKGLVLWGLRPSLRVRLAPKALYLATLFRLGRCSRSKYLLLGRASGKYPMDSPTTVLKRGYPKR